MYHVLSMTFMLELANAATLSNLAVEIDNLLINAQSKVTVKGTSDFTFKPGDCLRLTYN